MAAFWGLVIWAVYAFVVGSPRRDISDSTDHARRVLDERLARGEIDPDEYHSRLDTLTSHNNTGAKVGSPR
jgi:putative membrane protein